MPDNRAHIVVQQVHSKELFKIKGTSRGIAYSGNELNQVLPEIPMTLHKHPLWSRSVASALAMSMGVHVAGCNSDDPEAMMEQAREWRDKGDLRAAIARLRQLIGLGGEPASAHILLGELLLDQGDLAAAADALRHADAPGAESASATLLLGQTLLARGEHECLLASLCGGATATDQAAILGLRAQALLGLLNVADARTLTMQALTLHAESAQGLLALARLAVMAHQEAAAHGYLRRALSAAPGELSCMRLHADLLRAGGQLDDALAIYSAILERHSCNAQALIDLSQVHADMGRFPAAHGCIRQARKVAGSIPAVLFAEAVLHLAQGHAAQANELAERVLRAAPGHSPSLLLAASLTLEAGDFPHAEQLAQKFLRCHPGHADGTKLMVALQLGMQHPQAALALLAPLLAAGLADQELLQLAATANLRARQFTSAAALFAAASAAPHAGASRLDKLALSRMGTGDYLRQIAQLQITIEKRRTPRAGGIAAAVALLREERIEDARALLSMLEQTDNNPLVQTMLGEIHLRRPDPRSARNSFARALTLDPAYLPALDHLRQLDLAEQKAPDITRNRYLAALACAPANSAIMENLARLALAHQHPSEAISWMERACAEHPASLPLALSTGAMYQQLGMLAQAVALAETLAASHPGDAGVLSLLGQARLASGDHDGASEAFARLAAMQPGHGAPLLFLANAHLARQQDAAALACLKQALLIEPLLFGARVALVELLIRHQRFSEALSVAAAAQRLAPQDAGGHQLEGDVHAAQQHYAPACAAWERALALAPAGPLIVQLHAGLLRQGMGSAAAARADAWLACHPDDVPTRLYLAACHLAVNDLPAAAGELEQVLRYAPQQLTALNDLAWICQRRGDSRALGLAQRAHALAPDNPAILDTLGAIHLEQGELTRALPLLQKAALLAPQAGEVHLHLGMVLARTGDRPGARRALEKALVSTAPFPGRADATRLLASL